MKKYIITVAAAIALVAVHQTVLSEGWDWFGTKSLYDEPYYNRNDVKETASRAAQEGQYAGRRETALYSPLVAAAGYAGYQGWQTVRDWYNGPVKTIENRLRNINKSVQATLKTTNKHIMEQEKIAAKKTQSEKQKKLKK